MCSLAGKSDPCTRRARQLLKDSFEAERHGPARVGFPLASSQVAWTPPHTACPLRPVMDGRGFANPHHGLITGLPARDTARTTALVPRRTSRHGDCTYLREASVSPAQVSACCNSGSIH